MYLELRQCLLIMVVCLMYVRWHSKDDVYNDQGGCYQRPTDPHQTINKALG